MGTIFVFETDNEKEETKQERKDYVRGRRKSGRMWEAKSEF